MAKDYTSGLGKNFGRRATFFTDFLKAVKLWKGVGGYLKQSSL
jgi:hypothetical protein